MRTCKICATIPNCVKSYFACTYIYTHTHNFLKPCTRNGFGDKLNNIHETKKKIFLITYNYFFKNKNTRYIILYCSSIRTHKTISRVVESKQLASIIDNDTV